MQHQAVRHGSRASRRRLSLGVGLSLGALVLSLAVLIMVFGGAILSSYGKGRLERAFAAAYPGCTLQIGKLDYSVATNRLVAQSVTLRGTTATLTAGLVSLTDVRWRQILWNTNALEAAIANASLEATNLHLEFPRARYGIRCARLQASVPAAELIALGTELRTSVGDEAFFAAHDFRTTRFHLLVPECRVSGLAYAELLQGKAYRAKSIHCFRPSFDALVNCDKPVKPFGESPLMVHQALATIRQPLRIDHLSITNGELTYRERVVAGAAPGVLTFGAVSLSVQGIANRGETSATLEVRAQGDLMNAGVLKVLMTMPVASPHFSLRYAGSLSPMDLTRLDAFLDITTHTRIKSGSAQEAAFEIEVIAGQARGRVRAIYENLEIAVLDKQTGTEKGFDNRVISLLANVLKVRNANAPDASGSMKEGKIDYTKRPEETFLEFVWFALWSGIRDVISH